MKKILITGANSYIGTSFEKYIVKNFPNDYSVETVDMIDGSWRNMRFSGYDTVFHVAGIAHSDSGKISAEKEKLYRSVNTDLTVETAKKAKSEGVGQFIFMSSAIVYGNGTQLGKQKIITKDTPAIPANCYGDSKLQAENGIKPLNDGNFRVVVLRPPMIYGKGSKGNYPELARLASKLPVFPKYNNKRSMLYIENLCQFVKLMIDNEESGIFFPQNSEYTVTSEMVKLIAEARKHKILMIPYIGWVARLLMVFPGKVGSMAKKAFGDLAYDMEMSLYKENYNIRSLKESVDLTEG